MQVAIELDVELAARLAVEPTIKGMSVADALVFLAKQTLKALDDERDPALFAQRCMNHVAQLPVGHAYTFHECIPKGEWFDSVRRKALSAALRESPLIQILDLTAEERELRKPNLLRVAPATQE